MKQSDSRAKRPYEPPKLVEYGDLQKLTRGTLQVGADNPPNPTAHSKNPSCWIAEVLYGVSDPRTHMLRAWLNAVYVQKPVGAFIVGSYRLLGRQVAAVARRSAVVRSILRPLFERGLRRAQAHYMGAAA